MAPSRVTWGLRGAVLVCLALAALGPTLPAAGPRTRVLVVDRSRSVERATERLAPALVGALGDLGPDDRAGLVLAGARPVVALAPAPRDEAASRLGDALRAPVAPWGSDLGAALDAAGRLAGPGGEVLLVSDGRDTGRELLPAAARLAAAGARLHVLAPDAPALHGARVTALVAPERASPGARLALEASAAALRPARVTLTLSLERAGGAPSVLARDERDLGPGEQLRLAATTAPLGAGAYTVRARVRVAGRDDAPEDDALARPLTVGAGPRVLRVGAPLPGLSGAVSAPPERLSEALAQERPDLIVLHEVSAAAAAGEVAALGAAVRAGAGLAVVGAERAFGGGGYGGSALETLLPVTAGPGRERQRPLWLAVLLDASGSMGAPLPAAGASEGAATHYLRALETGLPLELLRPDDRLAVITFAERPELAAPLGPVPPGLVERLARREPRGGTDIGGALLLGLEALAGASPDVDVLVALATDAEDPDPARHADALRRAAAALAAARAGAERPARALLIHIGPGPLETLRALESELAPALEVDVARAAGAGEALRDLLEGELLAQRADRRAGPLPLTLTPAGEARGLELPASAPAFAPVRLRPEPERGAVALASVLDPELGEAPALVLGRLGLGRVLAAPLPGPTAAPLLSALTGELAAPPAEAVALRATREGEAVRLEATGPLPLGARALLLAEDGGRAEALLAPAGPDQAWATARAPSARPLRVILVGPDGARLAAAHVPDAGHTELAGGAGPDLGALAAAARAGRGALLTTLPTAARPLAAESLAAERASLSPALAALGLLLVLLEAAAAAWRVRRARAA